MGGKQEGVAVTDLWEINLVFSCMDKVVRKRNVAFLLHQKVCDLLLSSSTFVLPP